jgi:hypothetical protein
MDHIANLVRCVRGNKREWEEEHPPRPRCHRRSQPKVEPEIHYNKALDLGHCRLRCQYDNDGDA